MGFRQLVRNLRLMHEELERLEEIKQVRAFRKAERKRYEYLKSKLKQQSKS